MTSGDLNIDLTRKILYVKVGDIWPTYPTACAVCCSLAFAVCCCTGLALGSNLGQDRLRNVELMTDLTWMGL